MTLLQSLNLEHLPSSHTIHIALYRDVQNAPFLHQQLLAGNTDFEYAFIDASVIISTTQALAATYRAVNDLLENRLRSRNVHSEIVFSLSPNNNIAESFRRFGISPTTTNLLVIKVSTPSSPFTGSEIQDHLLTAVEGAQIPFSDTELRDMTDLARIRKIYKLNASGGAKKAVNEVNGVSADDESKELEVLVLGSMALRGATN